MNEINLSEPQPALQKIIFFYGLFLIFVGLTGVVSADFVASFNVLVFMSGILGLVSLYFCVTNPIQLTIYDVLAMILLVAYGTGTLNTLFSFLLNDRDISSISHVSEYWLCRTLGWAIASCGMLHTFGRLDGTYLLSTKVTKNDINKNINRLMVFSILFTLIVFLFIMIGKIGFMGDTRVSENSVQVSGLSSIVMSSIIPVGAVCFFVARKFSSLVHPTKCKLLIMVSISLLFVQFGFGRRAFVFATIIYFMVEVLANRPKKFITFKNVAVCICALLIIQFATTAFMTIRIAKWGHKESLPIFKLVPDAIKVYQDRKKLYLGETISENLSTRTFVLDYLASLSKKTNEIEPLYGADIYRAFITAVPKLFYPGKFKNELYGTEEELFNPYFYLTITDNANTILTSSVGDFGELGMFLLPIIACLMVSQFLKLVRIKVNAISSLLLSFMVLQTIITVEADVTLYFLLLRNIVIFSIIGLIFINPKNKGPK